MWYLVERRSWPARELFWWAAGGTLCFVLARFVYQTFRIRLKHRQLAARGIPMLPHSWLLGHLPIVAQLKNEMPPDISFIAFHGWLANNVKKYFPELDEVPPIVYLDMWPFLKAPVVVVFDVDASANFMANRSLQKHSITRDFLRPLTDGLDILSSFGEPWKKWRSTFNPGFSPRNVVLMIPELLEEMLTFADNLEKSAGKDGSWGPMFQLQTETTHLTLDVIFRACVGKRLHEQTSPNGTPLKRALLDQIHLMETGGDVARSLLNVGHMPWHKWAIDRNNSVMEHQFLPDVQRSLGLGGSDSKKITLLNQALKHIEGETGQKLESVNTLDKESYRSLMSNLKVLMLAGFETTSAILCWIFKELQDNPDCMAKVREEHDNVLGPDPEKAAGILRESPQLLNSLPYTQAVVRETLRMYPLTFAIREGTPDYFLTVPGSPTQYPTDGFGIWDAIGWTQRNPALWKRANDFVPERWLVPQGDELHPPKDGFRSFGMGQRACIGQELTLVEAKLVLVMCARKFDIEEAWDKWDLKHPNNPRHTVNGQRLYPAGLGTMHPKDLMPVHVRMRNQNFGQASNH